jgi:hypothetical protein
LRSLSVRAEKKQTAQEAADSVFLLLADLEESIYHRALALLAWRKRWRPKHVGWADVRDQALHLLYAALVLVPYVIHASWWTAGISGFVLGTIREVWQFYNWDLRIVMLGDRIKDAFFFAVGGVVVHLVITALQ